MRDYVERPWTLPEIAEIAGVPYRTLHGWVGRGVLTPSFRSSSGSGSPNLFSTYDALLARVLGDLRRAGLRVDALAEIASELARRRKTLRDGDVLLVNGSIRLLSERQRLDRALDEPVPALLYRMRWACDAIREATAEKFQLSS